MDDTKQSYNFEFQFETQLLPPICKFLKNKIILTQSLIFRSDIQKVLPLNTLQCKFQENSQFINIQSLNEDEVFVCDNCVVQENNISKYLLINKIIQNQKYDFFVNWPNLDYQGLTQQIRQFYSLQKGFSDYNQQIQQFSDLFSQEFKKALEQYKKSIFLNQNQILESVSNLLQYYGNISQFSDLKKIIIDIKSNKQQKSNKILEIITRKKEETIENTNKIKQLVEDINKYPQISLETLNLLKQSTLINIDSMCSKQLNQCENLNDIQDNDNLNAILKLISNKTNYCNQGYLESVKNELLKIQDSINILKKEKNIYLKVTAIIKFNSKKSRQLDSPYQYEMEISYFNYSNLKSKITYDNDGNQKFEVVQQNNCISYVKTKKDCLYKLIIKLDLINTQKLLNVGLVGQSLQDKSCVCDKNFINSFTPQSSFGDCGVSKIVEGRCLRDVKYPDEYFEIKITFCVQKKIFQVRDYPNKKNMNEINDNRLNLIDLNQEYYLGFEFYWQNDSITILHFEEIQIQN
ncbi:hypothetical protein ABPG72_002599 [Tetrahymena utriculariae]